MADERCGNETAGRGAAFAVRFFSMVSQILPARMMQMPRKADVTSRCDAATCHQCDHHRSGGYQSSS
jgi:hypothetical protein